MPSSYSEDQLVEQPAIKLFEELGWEVAGPTSGSGESGGSADSRDAGLLGREARSEVVLIGRLRAALERLNGLLPSEAIDTALEELARDRSAMLPEQANRELYLMLKDGVRVSVPDEHGAGQRTERVRVIDWEEAANNDFLLVSQFSIAGALYTCRPDLVGFVNGLPLVVIELKKPGVPARAAFDENLTHYKAQIPKLFHFNAVMIASNGTDSRIGSLTADWERFFEWKRIEREDEPRRVSMEVMLRGTCDKQRLLDLVENFTLFSEHKAGLTKIIGQNHQFIGVNNAITSMLTAREQGHGRGGVFWQTQGSGKSFSMVFFAQKVLRKVAGNWTFVVVTDRVELDEQIAKTFAATGAVTDAKMAHASSGEHLRQLLGGNQRHVFTLIHKFKSAEMLCDRQEVIVLTDEAHRSQYDTLALNMRAALPNATFVAFTGTPLMAGEERTKDIFGDYVSIYDFQQSVEDGATVPLFYENRTPELELTNPDLNDDVYDLIDEAGLDPDQEAKLARELNKQYHILTRDDRLETVAQDIVRHFLGRGFIGKAMVVSIDKVTALKMHDKVREYWDAELRRVNDQLEKAIGYSKSARPGTVNPKTGLEELPVENTIKHLQERKKILIETDMALIVSPGQNEIEQMKAHGLDIAPHRKRMVESQPSLDERFKDTEDPLRLVFVCAMWLTGFDAPSCSTVYLDKPMRNHTLMQTIARANRVFPGKHSGTIVDYANVFASLERALAIYGAGKGGAKPLKDKAMLVAALREAIEEATAFCAKHQIDLPAIEQLVDGSMERLDRVDLAMNALISPDPLRREFFGHERLVTTLYKAVKPDRAALEFTGRVACIVAIAEAIRGKLNPSPTDISAIMGDIGELLDESVAGIAIREGGPPPLDLSKVNFEALAKRLKASTRKSTDLEVLKAAIKAQLEKLIRLNPTRANFGERFEELIESYNNGSRSIEELFDELVKLSRSLSEEQQRHVRENLTEEEQAVLDILTRPDPELTTEERAEVKKVARDLLGKVKALLVLNWRQKSGAKAQVRMTIEDVLDAGLPRAYDKSLFERKTGAVYQHFLEKYPEHGVNVYVA